MKYQFEILKQTRANVFNAIAELSHEQVNQVPKGFNNNIAWNFCHSVLVLQLLCYKPSALALAVSDDLVLKYAKGSKPEALISEEEITFFKTLAKTSLEQIEKDFEQGLFQEYEPYMTSYNVKLNNIKEAIIFNNVHEALHYGYILALKRAISA